MARTNSRTVIILNPALYNPAQPQQSSSASIVQQLQPALERASLLTKAKRLRQELAEWRRQGMKFVSRKVRLERGAICEGDATRPACAYWNAAGNFGLGECMYPGCGCTKGKRALASSVCPHQPPKWPVVG